MVQPVNQSIELAFVPLDKIYFDSAYQREVKPHLVARILAKFSWAKFGAVVLSKHSNGRYSIIEGQHRWTAAKMHPDVHEIPAVILESSDVSSEAESFLAINRDRMAVSSVEQYWAGLTAGDHKTTVMSEVLKKAGCDVIPAPGQYKPNLTNSLFALGRSIERYGDKATIQALLVIRGAFPKEKQALRGVLIQALARILRANSSNHVEGSLIASLRGQSLSELTTHAEAFRKMSGGSAETLLAKAIVEIHNKGKRVNLISIGAQE
jgi:hypothetical protein